jgi:hypothetical protein
MRRSLFSQFAQKKDTNLTPGRKKAVVSTEKIVYNPNVEQFALTCAY